MGPIFKYAPCASVVQQSNLSPVRLRDSENGTVCTLGCHAVEDRSAG